MDHASIRGWTYSEMIAAERREHEAEINARRDEMAKTYTIATCCDLLIGTVPDFGDLDAAIRAEEDKTGLSFEGIETVSGLTLTDDPNAGQLVFASGKNGHLTDEEGRAFGYAVRAA